DRDPPDAAAHPSPAGADGRGRATVDLACPRPARARRPRHRGGRRSAPARNVERPPRGAARGDRPDRVGGPGTDVSGTPDPGDGIAGRPISILWLTSGLGCDGDSVAMTAAQNP